MSDDRQAVPPAGFEAEEAQATREERQEFGLQAVMAFAAILRNTRAYSEDNAVFYPQLSLLQQAMLELLARDGSFELRLADDGIYVNRQSVRFDASAQPMVTSLNSELRSRGAIGISASVAPTRDDLRTLVWLFSPRGPARLLPRGDPRRPLRVIAIAVEEERQLSAAIDSEAQLVDAYAHAVVFVNRTIEQLRAGGDVVPSWAASRVVQDLVDLQREMPRRFLDLARTKGEDDQYWGHHAANVAVLAITTGARLGFGKRRRHDLGMAALVHDVGVAALPAGLLAKTEALSEREKGALRASPLFAARAIYRDREMHPAALERAQAAYECHLDLVPPPGDPLPLIGFAGRVLALCEAFDALTTERPFRRALSGEEALLVMNNELFFRFDPQLLDLFPGIVEAIL